MIEQLKPRENPISVEGANRLLSPAIAMIAIYDHPRDFVSGYVARVHKVGSGKVEATDIYATADTFGELRKMLPYGMFWMPRGTDDDPAIMGVYI